jgi:hypothetical protein
MNRILTAAAIALALGAPALADADPVMRRLGEIQQAYIDCAKRITAEHNRCETSTKNEVAGSQMCLTVANQANNICNAMVDMFSALADK